jgi:hypothetical protein
LVILIFDSSFFNKRVKELKQQIYHKRTDPQTRINWWYKQKKKFITKKKVLKQQTTHMTSLNSTNLLILIQHCLLCCKHHPLHFPFYYDEVMDFKGKTDKSTVMQYQRHVHLFQSAVKNDGINEVRLKWVELKNVREIVVFYVVFIK